MSTEDRRESRPDEQGGELFTAVKIAPGRCPACLREFRHPDDILQAWPGAKRHYPAALFDTAARFPEIWHSEERDGEIVSYGQRLPGPDVSFVACAHCHNVTLQVLPDERTFATREEAEACCAQEAFHFVKPGLIGGGTVDEILTHVRESEDDARNRRGDR